jgi:hypothetical protein
MIILFFYIPANNQIFQSAETCAAFFIVGFSLLWKRKSRTHVAMAMDSSQE